MVRKGGVVNFFGGPPSGTKVQLDTNRLHYGDITLKASFHHTPATCRTAFDLVTSGRFKCAGVHYRPRWPGRGARALCADDEQEWRLTGDQDGSLSRWSTAVSDGIATQHALLGAPLEYLTPLERPTLAEAQAWCHELASSHYENFHVATFFLPRKVRPHFESIYAYCRVADDLGRRGR